MIHRARLAGSAAFSPASESEILQSVMFARLGVLFLLLLISVLQQIFQASTTLSVVVGYSLLTLGFGFNLFSALVPESWPPRRWAAAPQVLFDATAISVWIYFSGGKENLYSLLYLVQILAVSLILYQRAALLAAAAASVGFTIVLLMQPPPSAWMVWGVNITLFLTLGFVGGYLSEELHRTSLRLAEKSEKVEKLIDLQERIISNMPTGLLTVDGNLRVGFLNPAASHILDLAPDQIVGFSLSEVAPGLIPFFTQISKGSSRLQQVVEVDSGNYKRILRGDVAAIEVGGATSGLLHAEATEGTVLLFQDVTKLIHLEASLKQHEKLAAVGQLAAGIAHEIRNPLAGMSASIEMLRSSLPRENAAAEEQKLMDIALREIDRLNQLISEFLDYVKPQQLKVEGVDLQKQISDILFALRHPAQPGRIKSLKGGIVVRTDIDLKESYSPAIAMANHEKLKQVIWNLVINAIQAMDKPGTIEVGCGKAGNHRVRFWVKDQGQGMDEDTLSHLYEPFFTTKEKGTGLGLATAYKIVEALHGEILVESVVGQGTRFEVLLPAVEGEDE